MCHKTYQPWPTSQNTQYLKKLHIDTMIESTCRCYRFYFSAKSTEATMEKVTCAIICAVTSNSCGGICWWPWPELAFQECDSNWLTITPLRIFQVMISWHSWYVKEYKKMNNPRSSKQNKIKKNITNSLIQWNPVNATTFGPWKTGCINGLVVLKGFFK